MRSRTTPKAPQFQEAATVRLSVTIPTDDYTDLKKTADRKRVSVAWVVRDAVQEYLRNQSPLLRS